MATEGLHLLAWYVNADYTKTRSLDEEDSQILAIWVSIEFSLYVEDRGNGNKKWRILETYNCVEVRGGGWPAT